MHPLGGFNSIHPNAINPTSYSVGFLVSTLQLRGWRRYYAGNFFVITDWEVEEGEVRLAVWPRRPADAVVLGGNASSAYYYRQGPILWYNHDTHMPHLALDLMLPGLLETLIRSSNLVCIEASSVGVTTSATSLIPHPRRLPHPAHAEAIFECREAVGLPPRRISGAATRDKSRGSCRCSPRSVKPAACYLASFCIFLDISAQCSG